MDSTLVTVEVAYALPDKQVIKQVKVEPGTSLYDAAKLSGIAEEFAQIDLDKDKMGVFGKAVKDAKSETVAAGDRIEIYRPLIADPKVMRAKRADKLKQSQQAD